MGPASIIRSCKAQLQFQVAFMRGQLLATSLTQRGVPPSQVSLGSCCRTENRGVLCPLGQDAPKPVLFLSLVEGGSGPHGEDRALVSRERRLPNTTHQRTSGAGGQTSTHRKVPDGGSSPRGTSGGHRQALLRSRCTRTRTRDVCIPKRLSACHNSDEWPSKPGGRPGAGRDSADTKIAGTGTGPCLRAAGNRPAERGVPMDMRTFPVAKPRGDAIAQRQAQ